MITRLASYRDRAHLVVGDDDRLVDIEQASNGSLSSDPMVCLARWNDVRELARSVVVASDAPIGPWVCDVLDHPKRNELMISCTVNGEVRQNASMDDMIFDVSQLVSYLSTICELYPGDVIFTGTPSGVGHGRKPPVYLRPGDVIVTTFEGVGMLRNRCI